MADRGHRRGMQLDRERGTHMRNKAIGIVAGILLWAGLSLYGQTNVAKSPESNMTECLASLFDVRQYDEDGNGIIEAYEMVGRGDVLFRVADIDQDGKLDEWTRYSGGRPVVVVRDRNSDGVLDWWELKSAATGERIAADDDFDGKLDRDDRILWKHE